MVYLDIKAVFAEGKAAHAGRNDDVVKLHGVHRTIPLAAALDFALMPFAQHQFGHQHEHQINQDTRQ